MNKTITHQDLFMATLYRLINKGFYKIENNNIIEMPKVNDKNELLKLDRNERCFIKNKEKWFTIVTSLMYVETIEDLKEKKLINTKLKNDFLLLYLWIYIMVSGIILFASIESLDNIISMCNLTMQNNIFIGMYFFSLMIMSFLGFYGTVNTKLGSIESDLMHNFMTNRTYQSRKNNTNLLDLTKEMQKSNVYVSHLILNRTIKGIELYNKLNGLKKFMLDFSVIKDRKLEEITLWENYMIYAIIFDIPGILDESIENQYSKLYEKFKSNNSTE